MAGRELSWLVALVLSGCMLVRGQRSCSLSAAQFLTSTDVINVNAESVGGSTADVRIRVTWNTTLPPECVAAVRVEFRASSHDGPAVTTFTTTNTSHTEVILNGLQCGTYYYVSVVVTRNTSDGIHTTASSRQVQVFSGDIPVPVGVRAEVTADNTSIRVSWEWSCQGVLGNVRVHYQPEGGPLMMYTVDNTTATSATLPNLQCNTEYTVWVYVESNNISNMSSPRMVALPARAPPTPTEVTAEAINASSVRVTWRWTRSGTASSCFNTTTVTYRAEGGGESSQHLSDPAASEATLTDLQCNTYYTITVVATAGEHRREGVVLIPLQGPQHLSAAVLSPTSIHLTWEAPCHAQQYHIYYRGTCGTYVDEGRLDSDHQEYTLDGLQKGVNYSFTVNQTGLSGGRVPSTGPVYARTYAAGAPQLVTVTQVNSTTVNVSWSEVQCLNGSETVTRYLVQYQSLCGGAVQNVTTSGLIQNVSGLTPNCVYTFQVAAIGASQRIGPFSKLANVYLPDTPPISFEVPSQCTPTSAVAGVTGTAVLVLLVVAVVQSAVIWQQQRSIARIKNQTQRATAVTTEISLKECSAYGQIDQNGGGERKKTYVYECPQ